MLENIELLKKEYKRGYFFFRLFMLLANPFSLLIFVFATGLPYAFYKIYQLPDWVFLLIVCFTLLFAFVGFGLFIVVAILIKSKIKKDYGDQMLICWRRKRSFKEFCQMLADDEETKRIAVNADKFAKALKNGEIKDLTPQTYLELMMEGIDKEKS